MNKSSSARSSTIHVAGTVRNCGDGLELRLIALEEVLTESAQGRVRFHFFENDSNDSTRRVLLRFMAERPNVTVHLADDLDTRIPLREERLAFCRNQLLASVVAAESQAGLASVYFPIDLDLNIDWEAISLQLEAAITLVQSGAMDGVFPSSEPLYYDIHALRAPGWNSVDPWAAVAKAETRFLTRRAPEWAVQGALVHAKQIPPRRLMARGSIIPVESAFGGFGVYLLDRVRNRTYESTVSDRCEHVSFNRGLKLAVMTDLLVQAPPEHLGRKVFKSRAQRAFIRSARAIHRIG